MSSQIEKNLCQAVSNTLHPSGGNEEVTVLLNLSLNMGLTAERKTETGVSDEKLDMVSETHSSCC